MRFAPTFAALALLATPALAQQSGGMQGMNHGQMAGMNHDDMAGMMAGNPYGQAEMDMHQKMMSAMDADATETWVRKMIEHHRGGIAMSRIVIRDTKDAKVREMASKTIAEQTREVNELNAWLRAHGKKAQ